MTDPIVLISSLTGCTEEEARNAYEKTNDTVDAVELILGPVPKQSLLYAPKKRRRTSFTRDEEYLNGLRSVMKNIDEDIANSITQRGSSESVAMQAHHEETVPQNSYVQECQIPSVESEAEKQETEYQ